MSKINKQYFKIHENQAKIYGNDRVIVCMQLGKFYEVLGTDDFGANVPKISEITNLNLTRKGGYKGQVSIKHPHMIGFPISSLVKYTNILNSNGYSVAVVDQISEMDGTISRDSIRIYTPGTNIDNVQGAETSYIANLYFEEENIRSGKYVLCCGISCIDLSTGECIIHEAYSTSEDDNLALDETIRFLAATSPREVILSTILRGGKRTVDDILNYLELDKQNVHVRENIDPKYFKLDYQNQSLGRVYNSDASLVTPIERLNISCNTYTIVSLVYLLNYINDLSSSLSKSISRPRFYLDGMRMVLGNNAVHQLSIVQAHSSTYYQGQRVKCLLDVVDKTSTPMGKRFLRSRIISPFIKKDVIEKSHNQIEYILSKKEKLNDISDLLSEVGDIERHERRIVLGNISPSLFSSFINSYYVVTNIIKKVRSKTGKKLFDTTGVKEGILNFLNKINETFNKENLKTETSLDIKTPIFKIGVYPEIDELNKNYQEMLNFNDKLSSKLDKFIDRTKTGTAVIMSTEKEGYYVSLTENRANILKASIKKFEISGIPINPEDFTYRVMSGKSKKVKLFIPQLSEVSDKINALETTIIEETKKRYIETLGIIHTEFKELFSKVTGLISVIDFSKSGARVAQLYGYSKPAIFDGERGFVQGIDMRHPIVERLIDHEYVPHNITLGKDLNGMLIYGLNSAGKSVLMKAVGLNVILAQAGYYVAAKEFSLSPYRSVYTRITGNDNIFRGLSSFALEMVELNSIIKRSDRYTLVIGDEVCRGTENVSGNAIVASTVLKLNQLYSSFIFATHLHDIVNIKKIKQLETVKPFHIAVSYDADSDSIVYDRCLKEGSGERVYGILVARHIIQDKGFIQDAIDIKNEITEQERKSRYNPSLYLYQCSLCKREVKTSESISLETHHINHQKDCIDGVVIDKPHIRMNDRSNLISLCKDCHKNLHLNGEDVSLPVMTSKGRKVLVKGDNQRYVST